MKNRKSYRCESVIYISPEEAWEQFKRKMQEDQEDSDILSDWKKIIR